MKAIIYLLSFLLLTAMTFKNNVSPGDPIPGVDIKLGKKPPGGGQIIATAVTDKNGTVEFKNLAVGTGYYLEFSIREKGIKSSEQPITIEGIELKPTGTINTATNRKPQSEPTVIVKNVGDVEITVTATGNTIRGTISTSRSNIKGTINVSRSNIKNQ